MKTIVCDVCGGHETQLSTNKVHRYKRVHERYNAFGKLIETEETVVDICEDCMRKIMKAAKKND